MEESQSPIRLGSAIRDVSSPQKQRKRQARAPELVEELPTKVPRLEEPPSWFPEDSPDEQAVLPKLFFGLDLVLRLLAKRGAKPWLSVVRADVEAATGRELNDYRLAGLLGLLGPKLLDARWVGEGRYAKLEIFQLAEDGKERDMTEDETRERKMKFEASLAAAIERKAIPRRPLPPQPCSKDIPQLPAGIPALPEPASLATRPETPKGQDAVKRREAMLQRVRARQAAGDSIEAKEYADHRKRIVVCDNAERVHAVLQSLFARGEGKSSAASEAEILKYLSSASHSTQCMHALEKPAAIEALQMLAERSAGWFNVEAGVHNPDAKFFRRLPQGRAADALAAVKAERQDLEAQLRALCELAKGRVHNPAVTPPSKDEPAPVASASSSKVEPRSQTGARSVAGSSSGSAAAQQAAPTVQVLQTPAPVPTADAPKDTLPASLLKRQRLRPFGSAAAQQAAVPALQSLAPAPAAEAPKKTLATPQPSMRRLRAKTARRDAFSETPMLLLAGGLAKLAGLVKRPELNGVKVSLQSFDAGSNRWIVTTAAGEGLRVQPTSLQAISS